jgi:predicted dehydrogenase
MDNRLNRRRLLKTVAATVAAPYLITSAALGNADTPPASERVTVGHIGVGNRGGMGQLFSGIQECKNAQSVAIADLYADRRESYARMIKGKAYRDFRELLARDDIDAVVVATPDHWHVPIAIAAARAKKDAYVEKPLGLSIEQNLACLKVFAETGRVFQYGTQQRASPHFGIARDLIRGGKLGKIHKIEVLAPNGGAGGSTQGVPVPPTLDYEMWCGPAPMRPYTADRCHPPGTYWIYDYSIGYLGGWGAHPLDIMVWISDTDTAGPIMVEGTAVIPTSGLYDTAYDWDMKLQMGDGVQVVFKSANVDSTKFIGSEGWLDVRRSSYEAEPKSLVAGKLSRRDVQSGQTAKHCQNFVNAVKSRTTPASPLADAVRSDILSHLCDIAVRLKRKITWDPKTATIVGDDEAAKRMHRDMRAPWTL